MSIRQTIVPSPERDEFRERARLAQSHYAAKGCHYWLFEEASLPGAYVEFFEAKDRDALLAAHRDAPRPVLESARMYVEVELT
ncbi:MAG: hypothetical protein ACRENU_15415 [Gemmatimonadaceae bacterium]